MKEEINLTAQIIEVPTRLVPMFGGTRSVPTRVLCTIRRRVYNIPHFILLGWLLFYVTYCFMSLYGTRPHNSPYPDNDNVLEIVLEGFWKSHYLLLPEGWPGGKYTVSGSRACRDNDGFEIVCYEGKSIDDFIVRDYLQAARYNGMHPFEFDARFTMTFRALQKDLKHNLQLRRSCLIFRDLSVCKDEGIKPKKPSYLQTLGGLVLAHLAMVLAALSFVFTIMRLWNTYSVWPGVYCLVIQGGALHIISTLPEDTRFPFLSNMIIHLVGMVFAYEMVLYEGLFMIYPCDGHLEL